MKYIIKTITKNNTKKDFIFDDELLKKAQQKYPEKFEYNEDIFRIVLKKDNNIFDIKEIPRAQIVRIDPYNPTYKSKTLKPINPITGY